MNESWDPKNWYFPYDEEYWKPHWPVLPPDDWRRSLNIPRRTIEDVLEDILRELKDIKRILNK